MAGDEDLKILRVLVSTMLANAEKRQTRARTTK